MGGASRRIPFQILCSKQPQPVPISGREPIPQVVFWNNPRSFVIDVSRKVRILWRYSVVAVAVAVGGGGSGYTSWLHLVAVPFPGGSDLRQPAALQPI